MPLPCAFTSGNGKKQKNEVAGANVRGRIKRLKQSGDSSQAEPTPAVASTTLRAARSGQWMEAEAMRRWALEQLESRAGPVELVVDLSGIEHLDASALQILLAVLAEQRRRDGVLRLVHGSDRLRRWFEFAGAAELLGSEDDPASTAMEESQACAKF
jgi:anti-anti-sigma factor